MLKQIIKEILRVDAMKLILFQKKWRKLNIYNETKPNCIFDMKKVTVGKHSYANLNIHDFGSKEGKLVIGNFCSIADKVDFLLAGEHNYKGISTYPFAKKLLNQEEPYTSKGPIIIEDDVWIGYGATILSGVKIGKGAIIGAKSVVHKDVPPYAIYAGNRIVKYRFSEDMIEKIKDIDFNKLKEETIKENNDLLYEPLTEENVSTIKEIFNG